MLIVALMYFLGQLFIYQVTTTMPSTVPLFVVTSRKVLTIHQSYLLTNHKFRSVQLIGIAMSWLCIIFEFFINVAQPKNKYLFYKFRYRLRDIFEPVSTDRI